MATPTAAPDYQVGDRHTFWVLNQDTKTFYQTTARLVHKTDHLYLYVEDGVTLPLDGLRRSADTFERRTYPTLRREFGSEWSPGIDNDVRITVLHARIPGVGGYFSSADEYSRSVNQYSNEREMFYMNSQSARPGTPAYDATLAHEFTHMIQFNVARGSETWVSEGSAELGAKAAGQSAGGGARLFLDNPDLQLTSWAEAPSKSVAHYGAAFLFMDYFAQRYGGTGEVGKLVAEGSRGQASFDAFLTRRGHPTTFEDIFRDWVVANYLNDPTVAQGRYSYLPPGARARAERPSAFPFHRSSDVLPFGADYYALDGLGGDVTIRFVGQGQGKLVDDDARGGRVQWWSNRGDFVDSRLTRRVDLRGLDRATLEFWIWFDVEEDYDYGFVAVSADGGQTWRTLPGQHTTTSNPNGGNYGHGFTGKSGGGDDAGWVKERMDLTPFAGREVLLRFEYVTDDAFNAEGFGLDDIAIPELGFRDDAEAAGDWSAEGFVRTANELDTRYAVRLIRIGARAEVTELPLDARDRGEVVVRNVGPGGDVERVVVVVANVTPTTALPARYELTVSGSAPASRSSSPLLDRALALRYNGTTIPRSG